MRRLADRMEAHANRPVTDLRTVNTALGDLLLPHQHAEERSVFPELADRLGGRDPLGAMNRMHEEIEHLAARLDALVAGMEEHGVSVSEAREARRLLYALDAVIGHAPVGGGGIAVPGGGSAGGTVTQSDLCHCATWRDDVCWWMRRQICVPARTAAERRLRCRTPHRHRSHRTHCRGA